MNIYCITEQIELFQKIAERANIQVDIRIEPANHINIPSIIINNKFILFENNDIFYGLLESYHHNGERYIIKYKRLYKGSSLYQAIKAILVSITMCYINTAISEIAKEI